MEKIITYIFGLMLLISCGHDDYIPTLQEVKDAEFAAVFAREFGEIDKNQNWGFEEIVPVNFVETRSANVNRNQWADNYIVPPNVTANEKQLVINEFSKKRTGITNDININWSDYFIYQVYKGEAKYRDGFNGEVKGSDHMDHLQVKYSDADIEPANNGAWEHANDFNGGNNDTNFGTINGATLMVNSGTKDFAYHNSTDSKYHHEYIIIAGADIDESLKDFYYIGFDFYAHGTDKYPANKNMDVERDWVYNDWILRISPATLKNAKRIIAEDLGQADHSDFDYNDVVFDVGLGNMNGNVYAQITLQAAGGTLPLYIGGKNAGYEVHDLFGVPVKHMVNTINGVRDFAPVQFNLFLGNVGSSYNIKNIPVEVTTPNGDILLATETGEAPEKICVPITFQWPNEYVKITNVYPLFAEWVKDHTVVWY